MEMWDLAITASAPRKVTSANANPTTGTHQAKQGCSATTTTDTTAMEITSTERPTGATIQ